MNQLPNDSIPGRWLYCWVVILLSSMAGGMAWGIRGQYGHETGAMISGVLVGLTLTMLLAQHLSAIQAARAVALFALGISLGGAMTYGQTVGLTHDRPFVEAHNTEAFWWGMTGLAIKGGIWIGLGAALFGIGLSGKTYRPLEMFLLLAVMIVAFLIGVNLLNRPFDAIDEKIPSIYFSHYSHWAEKIDKPRRECWGGFLFALGTLQIYLGAWKRDRLAFALGCWGTLGGALGFPAGQSLQAANAWHADWIATLPTAPFTKHLNWWNTMETTFGLTFGAVVALGVYIHRRGIAPKAANLEPTVTISPVVEQLLVLFHVSVLVVWNFSDGTVVDWMGKYIEQALPLIILPILAVFAGRFWPFLMALPIVLIPIAAKTVRFLVFQKESPKLPFESWVQFFVAPDSDFAAALENTKFEFGWILYLVIPVYVACVTALYFANHSRAFKSSRSYSAWTLLIAAWLFFGLNYAFFEFPWPWLDWGGRTANAMIFSVCLFSLTVAASWFAFRADDETAQDTNIGS